MKRNEPVSFPDDRKSQLEELISDISTRVICLPLVNMEDVIREGLQRLKEIFQADIIVFLRYTENWDRYENIYLSTEEPESSFPPDVSFDRLFPWITAKVRKQEFVNISDVDQLPPEAATDAETLKNFRAYSSFTVPFVAFGNLHFGITGASLQPRKWPDSLVSHVKTMGEIIVAALERKQNRQNLEESQKLYQIVADFTVDMESWYDQHDDLIYISPSCEEITGYTVAEFLKDPGLIDAIVVPEDRPLWDDHLKRDHYKGDFHQIIFRIRRKDGMIRYIEHADRSVIDATGQFHGVRSSNRDITDRIMAENNLRMAYEEIKVLKQQLEAENVYLHDQLSIKKPAHGVIANSDAMKKVLTQVHQVAVTDSTVLLLGETGTGKELIARTIHNLSKRNKKLMVTVNCAALPASLIESELFGREKGAYTGALSRQIGRFELANGSTLFLDEIAELPLELQVKLLRVLQFGEFERLGSPTTHRVDVRIIAATNRDLTQAIRIGTFRNDLYYRLGVFPIVVPPLREHTEDIPALAWMFINELTERTGKRIDAIPRKVMERLIRYPWPGNVRELRNILEHAMILTKGHSLEVDLPELLDADNPVLKTLEEVERNHIMKILRQTHWRIRGTNGAAEILGLNEATLRFRMKKLGITRPE